jgi:hypothetical protein
MKKAVGLAVSLALFAFFVASLMSCGKPKGDTAIQTAENWLVLVDEEKYPESWEELAGLFKKNVEKDEWVDDLNRFRKPLGELVERELIDKQHVTDSSETPDGEYLLFQYRASFENKKSVVEAVSVIKDSDGKWRTLGYFLQQTGGEITS